MNALVLSGGSIKGSFQAGAIAEVLSHGFEPNYIWGVSVGALNGAFLADRAGGAARAGKPVVWKDIGEELVAFWKTNVTRPSDIVRRRPNSSIAWGALRAKFNGLVDTRRLQKLLRRTVTYENIASSPAKFSAGVVNLADARYSNADARLPNLLDYIIASTAIPVTMPLVFLKDAPFCDGGVRDIAPLRHAFAAGATKIVTIACYPEILEASTFNPKNLIKLLDRVTEILADEVLQNDLEMAVSINKLLPLDGSPATEGPFAGKRRVPLLIIRPTEGLNIDILDFDRDDIARAIHIGRLTAKAELHDFEV
jgi:NTE family protein